MCGRVGRAVVGCVVELVVLSQSGATVFSELLFSPGLCNSLEEEKGKKMINKADVGPKIEVNGLKRGAKVCRYEYQMCRCVWFMTELLAHRSAGSRLSTSLSEIW